MSLTNDETILMRRLAEDLRNERAEYDRLDAYYNAEQPLEQLGLAVPPELSQFLTIANWPRLAVDSVEERLDVEGFRYPDEDQADDELWRVWQENNLDEESQLAHTDALVFKRAYACVGTNEDDDQTPIVTVESPRELIAELDVRTREIVAGLRLSPVGKQLDGRSVQQATLYLPDKTIWLERDGATEWTQATSDWKEVDRDEHGLGVVPVVPLVNRPRTRRRGGVSEIADVIGLTDACARALTNGQLAAEALAVPQRGVLGASKGDFVDQNGKPLTVWETYFGAVWAIANKEAKTFQFDAADLKNFETIVNLYAKLVASLTGLPPHYLGFTTDNPASADAIRSSEARLVKRCERKQRSFSGSWEQVQRLVRRFQTGEWDEAAKRLETLWRDPATPTVAQRADAIVKLASTTVGGVPIMPLEMAREELGWSAAKIERARRMDEAAATDPTLQKMMRDLTAPPDAPISG